MTIAAFSLRYSVSARSFPKQDGVGSSPITRSKKTAA